MMQSSWRQSLQFFIQPKIIITFLLGISAGIPLLLIFSSLGLWLREAGVDRSAVTLFSWAALGYSFKFTWAPLVDKLTIPILTRWLGRRRSWLLLSQIGIITAIIWMASINPAKPDTLVLMAIAAVLLGFSSATQDIVIDAYRIEIADKSLQAALSSSYVAGYRIGMLIAGAGALFIASFLGSEKGSYDYSAWFYTYLIMSITMLIGVCTTIFIKEPKCNMQSDNHYSSQEYLRLSFIFILAISGFIGFFYLSDSVVIYLKDTFIKTLNAQYLFNFIIETLRLFSAIIFAFLIGFILARLKIANPVLLKESYIDPVADFFGRYSLKTAILVLALVGLYRISDIVLGVIANIFYQDLGFTKIEIATIVKSFGLGMTITGGFVGGLIAIRYGVMRTLLLGSILSVITNLLFIILAKVGHDTLMLYLVISADNLTAGIASAAFIAFLSALTNIKFTATQYAIFSSLMTLLPKVLAGYSGSIVDNVGYENFFWFAGLIGVPIIFLVIVINNKLQID